MINNLRSILSMWLLDRALDIAPPDEAVSLAEALCEHYDRLLSRYRKRTPAPADDFGRIN
jgi:hypothetical protein